MTALLCPTHGYRPLSSAAVRAQARADGPWRCPECGGVAEMLDWWEAGFHAHGCLACAAKLGAVCVWDGEQCGFFCDQLCLAVYREAVRSGEG